MKYTPQEKEINKKVLFGELFDPIFRNSDYKRDFYLTVISRNLDSFIDAVDEDFLNQFIKARCYFLRYFLGLDKIRDDRSCGATLSNSLLILVFSLIEGVMQEEKFLTCIPFLEHVSSRVKKEHLKLDDNFLENLVKEYREKYGATEKVRKFFADFVSEEDKQFIIKYYKNGKFKDINGILEDIYRLRSHFVHSLGMDFLRPYPFEKVLKYDEKNQRQYFEVENCLNINDLIAIVWMGIMSKFGLNTKI